MQASAPAGRIALPGAFPGPDRDGPVQGLLRHGLETRIAQGAFLPEVGADGLKVLVGHGLLQPLPVTGAAWHGGGGVAGSV